MNNSLKLADTLQGYMDTSGFRSSRLANAVNKTFKQPLISKTTIDNWTSGVSKSARDWHQIIAIAHILHIDEDETNRLLVASGHQTSIRELWLGAEKDNNAKDRLYLERWMKPLPLQSIHNDLRELTTKVSTIHDYVKQNADRSSYASHVHGVVSEWQIGSTEDVVGSGSSTDKVGAETIANPVLEPSEHSEMQNNEPAENQAWMIDTDNLEQINTDWEYNEGSVTSLFPTTDDQKMSLPPATNTHLFGVENVIQRLCQSLQVDHSPWVSALIGLGGTGKTAVSHAVAQRIIEEGTFDQVIWITIDQEAAPQAMDKVMVTLGEYLIPHQLDHTSQKRRLLQVKKALKAHRYLIIIDNLERSSDLSDLLTHLVDWSQPSKFLLTMRPFPPPDIDIFALQLNELSTPDAIRLLRHQIDTIGASQFAQPDTKDLEDIVAIVGGHPQALRLIAGLVRIQPISQIKINIQTANLNRISGLYDRIYKQAWQTLQPAEKQLLATLSSVTRTGTTASHLMALGFIGNDLFWPIITNLIELSLVERKQGNMPRFGLHSLTTQFLASQRLQVAESEKGTNAFWSIDPLIANLNYWQHLVENGRLDSTLFKIESRNLLHAIHTGLLSTETWSPAVSLLLDIFQLIEQSGYWEEWLIAMKKAVTTSTDETQPLKHRLLNRMGHLYKLNQNFEKAILHYEKAERIAVQVDDKKAVAQAQFGLSEVYRHQRAYKKAEHCGLQALAGFTNLGLEEEYLASTLNTLGLIAYARNDFETAKQYLTKAVPYWHQTNDMVGLARTLNHLGNLMQATNNFKRAVGFHNEALANAEQANSEIDKVMISLSLGTLYYNQDDFNNAEAIFRQADTPYLQQSEHLYYSASLANNIGNTLLAQRKYSEAELYVQKSITLWRELNDQLMLANTLGILGETLAKQERFAEALPYYEEATTLLENNADSSLAKKLYLEFSQQQREIEMKVA